MNTSLIVKYLGCIPLKKNLFILAVPGFSCSTQDLWSLLWYAGCLVGHVGSSSLTGIKPGSPVLGTWSLSHWKTGKSPFSYFIVQVECEATEISESSRVLCRNLINPWRGLTHLFRHFRGASFTVGVLALKMCMLSCSFVSNSLQPHRQ